MFRAGGGKVFCPQNGDCAALSHLAGLYKSPCGAGMGGRCGGASPAEGVSGGLLKPYKQSQAAPAYRFVGFEPAGAEGETSPLFFHLNSYLD